MHYKSKLVALKKDNQFDNKVLYYLISIILQRKAEKVVKYLALYGLLI